MGIKKRRHEYKRNGIIRGAKKIQFYTHPRYKFREPFDFFYGKKSQKGYLQILICSMGMLVALGIVCVQLLQKDLEDIVKEAWKNHTQVTVSEKVSFVDTRKIRILIKTENFKKEYHEVIQLSSPEGLSVSVVSGGAVQQTKMIPAGEVFSVQAQEWVPTAQCLRIETKSNQTGIQINSVKRSCGHPFYSGLFEIYFTEEGMVLINEVSLEAYLNGVVPSEMPESFGLEALKAQAVCARSYAYLRMTNLGYPQFQAAVDDSVKYQVYNNYEVTQAIKEAVDATAGEIGVYKNQVIDAYFFSTSCGVTTDWKVWGTDDVKEYLAGVKLTEEKTLPDLCDEDAFKAYINTEEERNYDSHAAWYRWEAELDFSKIEEDWKEKNGELKSLEVIERGCGGVINQLKLIGEKGEEIMESEYDVRDFLGSLLISCENKETQLETMPALLPSAYFYIGEQKEGIAVLKGGGYGHGCGMSQNGAKGMAQQGKNYEEILKFFYEGIELKKIY